MRAWKTLNAWASSSSGNLRAWEMLNAWASSSSGNLRAGVKISRAFNHFRMTITVLKPFICSSITILKLYGCTTVSVPFPQYGAYMYNANICTVLRYKKWYLLHIHCTCKCTCLQIKVNLTSKPNDGWTIIDVTSCHSHQFVDSFGLPGKFLNSNNHT